MTNDEKTKFGERLKAARYDLRFTQDEMAQRLNVSGNYIYLLESAHNSPGPKFIRKLEEVERELEIKAAKNLTRSTEGPPRALRNAPILRRAPVVSWATAGKGGNFNDLAGQIDEWMDTDCKDRNAYALIVEGDSMIPKFEPGDRVLFMPNSEPQNGDVVVARLQDSGDVYLKVYHLIGQNLDTVRLTSYNPVYPPLKFPRKAFRFIHPMYEMRRMHRRLH